MPKVAAKATDMSVDVSVDTSKASRRIRGYIRRTENQVGPLRKSRDFMRMANAANFAAGGLPAGGWAPLDPEYAAWKAAAFPGRGPLVRTGRMLSELTSLRGQAFEVLNPLEAVFRLPDVEYAEFHQYGTTKMPARKIVFEPEGFAQYVAEQVEDHIMAETSMARLRGLFR